MSSFRYPVEEIRQQCDLVEIISAHVALRKSGKTFIGLCPFHNEKTPSFHVYPDKQLWHCFGCGEGGDVFSFVQKIESLTFPEAVEQLARKVGITIERSDKAAREYSEKERVLRANNIACAFFRSMLTKSTAAQEYINKRDITKEAVERYKLGYAPDSWDGLLNYLLSQRVSPADAVKAGLIKPRENSPGFYDMFRDRLIFPIFDTSERIIAFGGRTFGDEQPKYLNSPETPLFSKNKTLYGLNIAKRVVGQTDKLIVVEGYMDVITTQSAGFENTVATLGTALTEEHVNVIGRFTRNVVLSFDADSAGAKAASRSAPLFEHAGFNVRILIMPKGEDPDSMLRGGDTARFSNLIEKALPIPDYRIKVALSRHNLQTDEGKTEALKEAIVILSGVDSAVERERIIRFLAKYHPNFGTGTTLAEDHIRAEVGKLRSRGTTHGIFTGNSSSNGQQAAKKNLSLLEISERLLLGIIIFQRVDAGKVFDRFTAKEFTSDGSTALAEALSRQYSELGKIDQEDLRIRVAGTPAEKLLMDILVGLDESELSHPVDKIIDTIITHKKNEKRHRMRELAKKINDGLIKREDPEYEEYYQLIRETSGPWRR